MKSKIGNESERRRQARRRRVRRKIERSDRASLTVYRSARHIYAQIIEGHTGKTITSASTRQKAIVDGSATGNVEAAKKVGTAIAEAAKAKGIDEVIFNRNGFLYHGRVKALADAAREAGLKF